MLATMYIGRVAVRQTPWDGESLSIDQRVYILGRYIAYYE